MVGGGGGSSTKSTIIVSIDTGSTVAAYSDSSYQTLVKTASEKSTGEYWLTGLDNGTYYLKATKSGQTTTMAYTISEYGVYRITMSYTTVPTFSYTGSYEIVEDDDTAITDPSYQGNWKIRFLSSGTLNFSRLASAENGIDLFLVGGGGGSGGKSIAAGGGGGYTASYGNISVSTGIDYEIVVGAGGIKDATTSTNQNTGGEGGASSAFGESVNGGKGGVSYASDSQSRATKGGDGGSGGAGSSWSHTYNGGSNGGDGGADNAARKGLGQGTSTREFYALDQDETATLFAGGGGNMANDVYGTGGDGGGGTASDGDDHFGGGAAGRHAGGSGIVIIRNARS